MKSEFQFIPANKASLSQRKPLCGVGINDAWYIVQPKIDGKHLICPFYSTWSSMLKRCYNPKYLAKHPTYIGCTVCEEWLTFSIFKLWMEEQDWEGLQLDKDIIIPNNKHYSPDTCVFVSSYLNSLLVDSGSTRGDFPIGVFFEKATNKYRAQCGVGKSSQKKLGSFNTMEQAYQAYKVQKEIEFYKHISEQSDPRIINGLKLHLQLLLNGEG